MSEHGKEQSLRHCHYRFSWIIIFVRNNSYSLSQYVGEGFFSLQMNNEDLIKSIFDSQQSSVFFTGDFLSLSPNNITYRIG